MTGVVVDSRAAGAPAHTDEDVPSFHALAAFACKANRLYRIHVRHHELVFIWAGRGSEGLRGAQAVGRAGSGARLLDALVARVVGTGMASLLDSSTANRARREVLDRTPLDRLMRDHPANVRMHTGGFEEVRLGPRSDRHARAYGDHEHQALLHVRHSRVGRWRLGLCSIEDVHAAMDLLPRVLGTRFRVDTARPLREQRCGCRVCRLPR